MTGNRPLLFAVILLAAACSETNGPDATSAHDSGAARNNGSVADNAAGSTTSPVSAQSNEAAGERDPDDGAEGSVSACLIQDGSRITANRLKVIGTEPFWAAEVEGRCVTYSTPENQSGTRIWTEFDGSRDMGIWRGFHGGKRFEMRTRPDTDCSDGMSNRRYPVAVTLMIGDEERRGCAAEPSSAIWKGEG